MRHRRATTDTADRGSEARFGRTGPSRRGILVGALAAALPTAGGAGEDPRAVAAGLRLVAAYPEHLDRIEGGDLVWRDGTRMALRTGRADKSFADWLAQPDLADMLRLAYPAGEPATPPARDHDPGRARNAAFFEKLYGPCASSGDRSRLAAVTWLPRKARQKLLMTTVNGVDRRLAAVSDALDRLGPEFDVYLAPSAGTINCRAIAGTSRASAHSHGIAIDIATARADYWGWVKPDRDGRYLWRNRIPAEIVSAFETHGFIWGGRWYHYDTMHFEYRPELLPPLAPLP